MKNLIKMDINELREVMSEFFEEDAVNEMLKLPKKDIINILEAESICTSTGELLVSQKHVPSRKKNAKRLSKHILKTKYKQKKRKKWQEKRSIEVKSEDTTNRSYMNKASKGYTKLHPQVQPKAKKGEKNS